MARSTSGPAAEERSELFNRIYAFYDVKILAAAIELGIFQKLGEASPPEALATSLSLPLRSTRALLVALGAMGLVAHDEGGYVLSEKGKRHFGPEAAYPMSDVVRFAEWQADALPQLTEALRDDKIIWDGFNHYLHNIDDDSVPSSRRAGRQIFNAALAGSATATAKAVLGAVDLKTSARLLDIGGNLGVFSATVLSRYEHMRSTVFDLPEVAPLAQAEVRKRNLAHRIKAVGGDFVSGAWPADHDLITFIRILATRPEDEILFLLRKAYDALPSGGKCLFYEEHVLGRDRNAVPPGAGWASMFIFMGSHGEVRHIDEWERFFAEAGFVAIRGVNGTPWGIVMGEKP